MRLSAVSPFLLLLFAYSDAFFFPGAGFRMPPCRCFPMMCPPQPPPICPALPPCPCGATGYPQPPLPEPAYQIAGGSYETSSPVGFNRSPYVQPQSGYLQPQAPPPQPYPSSQTDGYVSAGGLPSPIQPDASAGGSYVDSTIYDDSQNQQTNGDTVSSPSQQPNVAYSNDESASQTESSQTEVGASTSSNGYHHKARAAKTVTVPVDPKCNSSMLRKIMDMKINGNPAESKRAISKAAVEEFLVAFDVICSTSDFSYLANSRLFCEHRVREVTCFAFQH